MATTFEPGEGSTPIPDDPATTDPLGHLDDLPGDEGHGDPPAPDAPPAPEPPPPSIRRPIRKDE
jgi:hypothetical protein